MKLPNGFGSIFKLSGKRRKPWAVRLTTGFDDEGKQLYKYFGYFESRQLALTELSLYNADPYDFTSKKLTVAEIYARYTDDRYSNKDEKIPAGYVAAYNYSAKIHNMSFADVRTPHIQNLVDSCTAGYSTKKNIRILFNLMYKFCMINEITDKNYAQLVKLPQEEKSDKHQPFTLKEIDILWENTQDLGVRFALIYIYTGLRPTELLKILSENVFLDERYMLGGMKTTAGKNRIVPIADKIYPFIADLYNENNKYLVTVEGEHLNSYDKLRYRYWERSKILKEMNHLPHDGRHTCATLMDSAGIPISIAQKILGHAGDNITRKVYIHKTLSELVDAINKI